MRHYNVKKWQRKRGSEAEWRDRSKMTPKCFCQRGKGWGGKDKAATAGPVTRELFIKGKKSNATCGKVTATTPTAQPAVIRLNSAIIWQKIIKWAPKCDFSYGKSDKIEGVRPCRWDVLFFYQFRDWGEKKKNHPTTAGSSSRSETLPWTACSSSQI